jgi:hypothetical protein
MLVKARNAAVNALLIAGNIPFSLVRAPHISTPIFHKASKARNEYMSMLLIVLSCCIIKHSPIVQFSDTPRGSSSRIPMRLPNPKINP